MAFSIPINFQNCSKPVRALKNRYFLMQKIACVSRVRACVCLRIIHKESTSYFEGLLIKRNSVSVHQRNLQLVLIEIYKTINNLNPSFMAEVFVTNVPYNLRGITNHVLPKARTNLCGIDTGSFVG